MLDVGADLAARPSRTRTPASRASSTGERERVSSRPSAVACDRRRSSPVLELAPLAHRPQHEHGDDGGADRRRGRRRSSPPIEVGVAQSPVHCTSTSAQPISPPAAPATRMAAKARARAKRDGRADSGRAGSGPGVSGTIRHRRLPARACPRRRPDLQRSGRTSRRSLRRIRDVLPDAEVLVVDDASPDGTADLARSWPASSAGSTCFRARRRSGSAPPTATASPGALGTGAPILVQMDADLSHDPAALPALVSAVEHGADLAMGSRYVPGGRILGWSCRRRWLSRWGNRYAAGHARAGRERRHVRVPRLRAADACRGSTWTRCAPRATASRSR